MIGMAAGSLSCFTFFPQLWKTWRSRSAKDVSLTTFLLATVGAALWLTYGIFKDSPALIFTNVIVFFSALLMLVFKLLFKD